MTKPKRFFFIKLILTSSAILLAIIGLSPPARAWLDCPYGRVNDPYPGLCDLYTDTNNNQICDRSEPEPLPSPIPAPPATTSRINLFWPIFLPLAFYFLHWYLTFKVKVAFSQPTCFRFSWNLVLLVSFATTAVLGLIFLFLGPNRTLIVWHNYSGVVAVIVGLLHFLARLKPFFNQLKKSG